MDAVTLVVALVGLIVGGSVGFIVKRNKIEQERLTLESKYQKVQTDAELKAKDLLFDAKNEAFKIQEEAKKEERKKRNEFNKIEERLLSKEQNLDKKIEKLDQNKEDLDKKLVQVRDLKDETQKLFDEQQKKLEEIASLSKEEAKKILIKQVEDASKEEIINTIKRAEKEVRDEADQQAKFMIAEAISRFAADTTMESTITTIAIPNDDMKGRIIGREGRNINTLERATGVDVIVDDTPGSISISGFDLMRRYIAKIALTKLVEDGRIHPARIEEVVEKVKEEVNVLIKELGEKAVFDTGVVGLPLDLIKLLGRLKFRVSLGQNVLKHSMEVSYLAGILAGELGADVELCRKAGLLHDIGKAVDHEIQGHHSIIGRDILKKYGVSQEVIHCVEAHHDHVLPETIEAKIVQAANLIANARPGANKENLDNFIKRLSELENLVKSFDGVTKVYAIQTGRQVRVFVNSDEVDDLKAIRMSRDIVSDIEKKLKFPGQIKVDVIRETRAESFAT